MPNVSCTNGNAIPAGGTNVLIFNVSIASNALNPLNGNTVALSNPNECTTGCTGNNGPVSTPPTPVSRPVNTVLRFTLTDPAVCTSPNGTVDGFAELSNPNVAPTNAVLTFALPTGLTALPGTCVVSPNIGSCTVTPTTVTWSGSLNGGAMVHVSYKAQIDSGVAPGATLCVNTSASFDGGAPMSVQACLNVNCPVVDLAVTKTDGVASVSPGGTTTYTIVATNNGTASVTGASVTDTMPAALTGVSWTCVASAGSLCNAPNGTGDINTTVNLSPGGTATFTATGTVSPSASGTLVNTVTVAAPNTVDPNTANNVATDTDTLAAQADLSIAKDDSVDPVTAGANVSYTLTVNNAGPSAAQNVVVSDPLPAGLTFTGVSTNNAAFTCSNSAGTVTCNAASLASGASAVITIVAQVNANVAGGTTLSNTATISSDTADSAAANNSDTETTAVNSLGAVAIRKQVTGMLPGQTPNFSAGDLVSYTISVENTGTSAGTLSAAGINDTIPAGASFHSFAGTGILGGSACSMDAGLTVLTCLPSGQVPAGTAFASNAVTLVLKINPGYTPGNLVNAALANVTNNPAGNQNLSSSATVTVVREPDLAIDKTGPDFVRAGEEFIYTLKLTNKGPSWASAGAVVKDTLPAGLTYLNTTVSGAGGFTCSFSSPDVTCTSATALAVGSSTTFSVRVRVDAAAANQTNLRNLAQATAAGADSETNTANNNDEFTSVVTTGADLEHRSSNRFRADKSNVCNN